ncbi:hypothetical protein LCGC14_1782920 [marine sediment metagenome]|uniref:Uncharacterized protein n=1 Tax=marine sediment metagenome TaxID=412755 RepID=A0A0F9GUZ1_9ZZZZ|nr:hypothetical protein [Leeuwenhoekiella sp.]
MKTKHLIILILLVTLQLSCGDENKTTNNIDITGSFQKLIPATDTRPGKIVLYEIKHIDAELYSLETSSKSLDKNSEFTKNLYLELEYRPENRILRASSAIGSGSFQFSDDYNSIKELGSDSKVPYVRID